ncbi:uncharacterized protein LOC107604880 [Arachis ipaensis]|uniref:uncharacterized protein LOC107604880 n=1 Tax=Arachis ipaensis TaxID=130454 RepID=UPI0007AF8B9E|nr:uncharacterized protein LOC107604880 [Arachis ipaensis]XP_025628048.1 uncharacterized protein LOC112721189 [Arachis hypogaea]
MSEIGFPPQLPSQLKCDNKATISISENPVQHDRTKHVEVDRHFIKEKIENDIIELPFVRSEDQLADILTKVVSRQVLAKVLTKLSIVEHPTARGLEPGIRAEPLSRPASHRPNSHSSAFVIGVPDTRAAHPAVSPYRNTPGHPPSAPYRNTAAHPSPAPFQTTESHPPSARPDLAFHPPTRSSSNAGSTQCGR